MVVPWISNTLVRARRGLTTALRTCFLNVFLALAGNSGTTWDGTASGRPGFEWKLPCQIDSGMIFARMSSAKWYLGETPTVYVPSLEARIWRELVHCPARSSPSGRGP